jgi:hypothetical protein
MELAFPDIEMAGPNKLAIRRALNPRSGEWAERSVGE